MMVEVGQGEIGEHHGIEGIHASQDDDEHDDNEVIICGDRSPNDGNEVEDDG